MKYRLPYFKLWRNHISPTVASSGIIMPVDLALGTSFQGGCHFCTGML